MLTINDKIRKRMERLERRDHEDRGDGTERKRRLRQVPPETGRFISLMCASCPAGSYIEIGTSAGYSALWLILALAGKGVKLKTFEMLPEKIALAKETFREGGVEQYVELVEGDALKYLGSEKGIAFCFIDCEKEIYMQCWDLIAPRMVPGGFVIADNATNHYDTLKPMIEKALSDERFDCMVLPIGKGELVCRRR